jgi:hypothetical protein
MVIAHRDGDNGVVGCSRRERPETLLQYHCCELLLCCTFRADTFMVFYHRVAGQSEVSEHMVAHPKLGVILCIEKSVSIVSSSAV